MQKENSLLLYGNDAPAARDFLSVKSSVWARDVFYVTYLDVLVLNLFWLIFGILVKFCSVGLDNVNFLNLLQRNALVLSNSMRLSCYRFFVCRGKIVNRRRLRGEF